MNRWNLRGLIQTTSPKYREKWEKFDPFAVWITGLASLGGALSGVKWGDVLPLLFGKEGPVDMAGGEFAELIGKIQVDFILMAFVLAVVGRVLLRPLFNRLISVMVGQNFTLLAFVYLLYALQDLFSGALFAWVFLLVVLGFVAAIAIEVGAGLKDMIEDLGKQATSFREAIKNFGVAAFVIAVVIDIVFLVAAARPAIPLFLGRS